MIKRDSGFYNPSTLDGDHLSSGVGEWCHALQLLLPCVEDTTKNLLQTRVPAYSSKRSEGGELLHNANHKSIDSHVGCRVPECFSQSCIPEESHRAPAGRRRLHLHKVWGRQLCSTIEYLRMVLDLFKSHLLDRPRIPAAPETRHPSPHRGTGGPDQRGTATDSTAIATRTRASKSRAVNVLMIMCNAS